MIYLSKPKDSTTPMEFSNFNYGLWVIMCVVGSSIVTNAPLWWRMLIMGAAMHVWRQGHMGTLWYLPLNLAVILKLL